MSESFGYLHKTLVAADCPRAARFSKRKHLEMKNSFNE